MWIVGALFRWGLSLRLLLLLATVAGLAAGSAAGQSLTPSVSGPLAAPATRSAPISVINLVPWRTRWVAEATIAGKPRKLLFDSGGGDSQLSPSLAAEAGCKPWGQLVGFNMHAERYATARCDGVAFVLAGRRHAPPSVGLLDMGAMNPRDSELSGLLALDAFEDQAVTLDLRGGHIVVESDLSLKERTAKMQPLPIRLARESAGRALAVYVAVPTAEGPLWVELDSGNGGTVLIAKANAKLVGLDPEKEGPQHLELQIAPGVRLQTDQAYSGDLTIDGNLGMPFMRDWIITLDLRRGKAWIAPAQPQG